MDGEFVQNYTLGTDFVNKLHEATNIPLDIHMMVVKPELKLDWFEIREGDYVSVHYEAVTHLQALLAKIHAKGGKTMLAINPGTPISVMEEVLPDLDAVLVMTVNPGFAGQKLVKSTLKKISDLRAYLDANGYSHIEIEVDGNVSIENAIKMKEAGANIFVLGTSAVFIGDSIYDNVLSFREKVFN
jgi:ribulose-phosphate 3-epimerase